MMKQMENDKNKINEKSVNRHVSIPGVKHI